MTGKTSVWETSKHVPQMFVGTEIGRGEIRDLSAELLYTFLMLVDLVEFDVSTRWKLRHRRPSSFIRIEGSYERLSPITTRGTNRFAVRVTD